MSFQGKEFTPEMAECVVRLTRYFDEEKAGGSVASTQHPTARTAAGLRIGEATVKRIMSRFNRTGEGRVPSRALDRGRLGFRVSQHLQPVVRAFIRAAGAATMSESYESLVTVPHAWPVGKCCMLRVMRP